MADIFTYDCEAIINPVNCVGVMGAGLAKKFKDKYPDVFLTYFNACKQEDLSKKLKIGTCLTVKANDGKYIIHFPTKDHFKDPSKMEYIELGLDALIRHVKHFNIKSVAIPALGSGLGGLNWSNVKPLILKKLDDLSLSDGTKVNIKVFDPVNFQHSNNENNLER